jgi:CheY-like chemotaxis protein
MNKTRVLIVDDDVNLSRLSAMILENSGSYEVRTEKDSVRALETARQFRPEIMLLDVDMPSKSGGEVADDAKRDPLLRNVPILFLTGLLSRAEGGRDQIESGGMSFLSKPVMPDVLLTCVGRLVPVRAVS